MTKPLSDEILEQARDVWDAMQGHRFVRDIEADQLEPAVFRRYLTYENAFVETAIQIFGYSLVKAPGLEEQRWIIGVLGALAEEQIAYFHEAFATLGMDEAEWCDVPLPAAVVAFRDGMLAIAAHGSYVDGIAAMFAAEWMYWTWCTRASSGPITDPVLKQWVDLHAAEAFAAQTQWLRRQIDLAGLEMAALRAGAGRRHLRLALELEIGFHSAPYQEHGRNLPMKIVLT